MTINFKPLSKHVGAEVIGLDLSKACTAQEEEMLRGAFVVHDLLLVRQAGLSPEDQARFARIFGDIEIRNKSSDSDGITQHVSNTRKDGILGDGEILFHQDHLFYQHPLKALILYGLEIPASGSVTKFRSGTAVLEQLPASLRRKLESVECLHLYNYAADYTKRQDLSQAPDSAPRAWQPLVWNNTEANRKTLWLSPLNVVGYRGVTNEEGEALLQEVNSIADSSEETVYAHQWAPGDLLIWNNQMLHHARMPFNNAEPRTLRRTPIVSKTSASEMSAEMSERIESIRKTRGFILPHHGLMAICDMPLLKAYDAFYTELALNKRALDEHDKELVWVMCLIATKEAIPIHHIRNLRRSGGSDLEVAELARIAAVVWGATSFKFVANNFIKYLPDFDRKEEYLKLYSAASNELSIGPRMASLTALAACVCQARWEEFGWHLANAYELNVPEPEIAEAISIPMFPGDAANYFYPACQIWRRLIRSGTLNASAAFRTWAYLPDHDPTAG